MNTYSQILKGKAAFALIGAAALVAGPALHAAPPVETVYGTDGIEWVPTAVTGNGSYTLTVSTPEGDVVVYDFGNGEIPYYVADAGDGGYKYELVFNPSPNAGGKAAGGKKNDEETDENGRPASASAAGKATGGGLSDSGYFTVANGSVADPDLAEE